LPLALLVAAGGAAAQNAARLPGRADAGAAYTASVQDLCRALIDQCDEAGPTMPSSADEIEQFRCSSRATLATCHFRYSARRCQARFVLRRTAGDRRWEVERRPARVYGQPQVTCRDALRDSD